MENMQEKMEQIAMEIILAAGDARVDANKALDAAEKFDFKAAGEYLKAARGYIIKAHNAQTDTMQKEIASEESFPTSILFNHAQDTLMTIMTEINLTERIVKLYEIMNDKISSIRGE